eukprot:Sspe_Gene.85861::Locus_56606_Transcript_1_1_Confidence_1.000_Length_625::g.85861::m.85861
MSLSRHAVKNGASLPPRVADEQLGEVRIRIDKLLWNHPLGEQPKSRVTVRWWGDNLPSPEFHVATSLQSTQSTTVVFPVCTDQASFSRYLSAVSDHNGFRVEVVDWTKRKLLGTAVVDLAPLSRTHPVQGYFKVLTPDGSAIATVRMKASVTFTARPSPPKERALESTHQQTVPHVT